LQKRVAAARKTSGIHTSSIREASDSAQLTAYFVRLSKAGGAWASIGRHHGLRHPQICLDKRTWRTL
jgi:hypothetical protein